MLPLKTILNRVRNKLHDEDAITYDDNVIVAVLNDGIRFIRRTIAQIQPELLAETTQGTMDAGENTISLPQNPLVIVEVLAGDKVRKTVTTRNSPFIYKNTTKIYKSKIPLDTEVTTVYYDERPLSATNMRHVFDRYQTGTPRAYYRTGLKTLELFPVPTKVTGYTVRVINDLDELTLADSSPLINDFDDFLVEYAALRLSVGNEYDMTQETQIMDVIVNQIQAILAPPPPGVEIAGYWDAPVRCVDYGRRVICF